MKNDFYEFLTNNEEPPKALFETTKKDITLSFRAGHIISKFIFFLLLGALFSLTVCPQFGIGLVEGHGITHAFRMIGDWACAAFCGSLFLSSGMIMAFIGMKGEELWWIWRRYKYPLVLLPAFFWSFLMFFNKTFNLTNESMTYHLVWMITAISCQLLLMKLRSAAYYNLSYRQTT